MKILQINKFFYQKTGAERYFFNVSELLKKHNHKVIFFSMKNKKNFYSEYEKYFVSNVDFSKIKINFSFSNLKLIDRVIYSLEAKRKIEELIKKEKPDIAHIHNIYHQISPSILSVLKKYKIPVVMTLHDYKLICPNYILFTNNHICEQCKKYKYYNCILNKCIKNSYLASGLACIEMYIHKILKIYEKNVDIFITPSQFMKDKCVEFGINANKIIVLPHFVTHNTQHVTRNIKYGTHNMLYFGRLAKEKGINVLLDAMKYVKHCIKLKIVGDGPELLNLKSKILNLKLNNRVKFLGHLEGRGLEKIIAQAMFVVVPSICYEVFGLVILESFIAGKPIIGSKIGGIPELIDDYKTGLLFKPGNAKSLAEKIDWLIERPEEIKKMGQAGFVVAKKIFSAEEHYNKLMDIYEKIKYKKQETNKKNNFKF